MTALFLVFALAGAADEAGADMPRLRLREPVLDDGGLVVPIVGPAANFERSERRIARGKLVIFTPGLTARASNHAFAEGPLKSLEVRPVRYGVAFWLEPRISITLLSEHVTLPKPGSPYLRIGPTGDGAPTALAASATATPRTATASTAPVDTAVDGDAPLGATTARAREPSTLSSSPPVESAALGVPSSSGRASTLLWATLGLAVAAAAALGLLHKRRATAGVASSLIDVVAVRPFGPKHRIAVVDACGDRLLIAASDTGVQLLSRVGAGATLTATTAASADAGARSVVTEPRSFAAELAAAHRLPEVPADLQGLMRLRTATESRRGSKVESFAGGLLQ